MSKLQPPHIRHALNQSKSKTAFSFSKQNRFLPEKRSNVLNAAIPPINSTICPRRSVTAPPPSALGAKPTSRGWNLWSRADTSFLRISRKKRRRRGSPPSASIETYLAKLLRSFTKGSRAAILLALALTARLSRPVAGASTSPAGHLRRIPSTTSAQPPTKLGTKLGTG